ncbi:MAG: ferrous iron transport protein A [Clostridia bacterium]|nr:ferrous iron transport protein A [Clostridia bacterium]
MEYMHRLSELAPGQQGRVKALLSTGSIRRRLLDIGLIENTTVECIGRSPGGDPSAYYIRGAVIAIRSADSKNILIE